MTFFAPTPLAITGTRRDVLCVGIALLGVWTAADGVVAILRAGGAFVYYSQQPIPASSLERSWPQVVANLATVVAGTILARSARRLVIRLDAL